MKIKRFLSLVLSFVIVLGMVPLTASNVNAAESVDLIWPCESSSAYRISCIYYYKQSYTNTHCDEEAGNSCPHHSCRYGYVHGIDITGGGNIVAAAAGTVEEVAYQASGFGNYIVILHTNGHRSLYAHLQSTQVSVGDVVSQGQRIGVMGNSGNSSGTHLHFEYSGSDPFRTYYKDNYYSSISFESNCFSNNDTFNSDSFICDWINAYYKLSGGIYIWNGTPPIKYEIDTRYPPFYGYTLSTGNVDCYYGVNGSRAGSVYPGDRCLIEEVYTNGWCKFQCPWPDESNMKTVYAPLSIFIYDTSCVPLSHNLLSGTQGYKKNNMAETYEWLDAKSYALRVSKVNGLTQAIVWKDGVGNHLTWFNHTGDYIEGLNIGTDFYAYIINTDQWRHVTDDGDNVTLRTQVSNETQIWHFLYQGNGYYKIKNAASGEDLLVYYADDRDGANITTLSGGGTDNELWMLCGRWNDRVTLEPKHSNRVMDVVDNSTAEGANIQLWTYNGTGAQQFDIWTDLRFTIYYGANGGSNPPSAQGDKQYRSITTLTTNKPTAPVYTITYNANGGSVSTSSKTVTPTFKNWNTKANGTGTAYNAGASAEIRGDLILYAQWNPVKAGTLVTPTRSGYTFTGWYTAASGGTKVTSDTVVTGNMTVYAQWKTAGNFTVTYNANGGTGAPASQTKVNGKVLTLSTTIPTRFGYNFKGWATSASATSATYQPGDSFTTDANTTLYAVWSDAETISTTTETFQFPRSQYGKTGYYYKFTPSVSTSYSLNLWDGDEEGIVSITLYDSNKNKLAQIAGTEDAAFSEFDCTLEYVVSAGSTYYVYLEFTDTDNAYVYLYVYRGYLLSYNANGGSNAPAQEYYYYGNGSPSISTQVPNRRGYTFVEWNTKSDGSGNAYDPGDRLDEDWANVTLYAIWEEGCSGTHSYRYSVTKNPTTSATGTLTGTCTDCSGTTTVTLPKLNTTDYTYKVTKEPSYTATGTGRYTWKTTTYGTFYFDVMLEKLTATLAKIEVASKPTKTVYEIDDSLDTTGLSLKATYSDGSTKTITSGFTTNGFDSSTAGEKTVTVTYGGKSTSFKVTVEIPECPHTSKTEVPSQSADCVNAGNNLYYLCDSCGLAFKADGVTETTAEAETIAAQGHDFIKGECFRCDAVKESRFVDVPTGEFYFDPVEWAVENEITNGTDDTHFSPNGICMRGHVVTFLWRALGSPEPETTVNPFVDVKKGDYFYKAVLWAYENEITNGIDENHFAPTGECNRAQVVTFLWRAMEKPKSTAEVGFTDVVAGEFYSTAVAWAVENGITNGIDATHFAPTGECNRAQVVTFLQRTFAG